ncbi:hypothetical protein [Novosphingobium sp. JCM 18896]|uniref:hypothetical protein n=1 Tax=Novosphingobium sp. JCM 18896 TaxID=2989731 RepID=UPI0022223D8B|nr:hypothetical protein [Novosphingobium sp. JCM 18896]MCW1432049.1 hypothetical protein [Novosphingobium sp. JCM 18896]
MMTMKHHSEIHPGSSTARLPALGSSRKLRAKGFTSRRPRQTAQRSNQIREQ